MVDKWRLPVIGEDKELENMPFVLFSFIVGTLCTFVIIVHAVVFAPPFACKYALLSACFLLAHIFVLPIVHQD